MVIRAKMTIAHYQLLFAILLIVAVDGRNDDLFNYGQENTEENGFRSFGQLHWNEVTCDDVKTCTGYPDKYPFAKGWSIAGPSNCRWCPADNSQNCGLENQSPINLERNRAIAGDPHWKECPDWHWISYHDDSCSWDDMKDQFTINRHALQIHVPQLPNGDIDCIEDGQRRYAKMDLSKGFPDFFLLQRIDIQVPSQHTQDGTRYAAELVLAHFYEKVLEFHKISHISFFLQDYPDAEPWAYLDKLICAWRKVEEDVRAKCGLPPAPAYGRCKLFRGQDPPEHWLSEAGIMDSIPVPPTTAPTATQAIIDTSASPTPSTSSAPFSSTSAPVAIPIATNPPVSVSTLAPIKANQIAFPDPYDCKDQRVDYHRMCDSLIPCCEEIRSDTDYCWSVYDTLGSDIGAACYHCCRVPKMIGPPNPEKDGLPKTIQCSAVKEIHRMCRADSCCSNPRSKTEFCTQQYKLYGDIIDQVCHYCCQVPLDVGPSRRLLELDDATGVTTAVATPISHETFFEQLRHLPNSTEPLLDAVSVPPPIDCNDGKADYEQMCISLDSCCGATRSDSSFCWQSYDALGDAVPSACYHCCKTPKVVGPPTPEKPGLPKTIQCSAVDNPHRMCKVGGCCSVPRSASNYCTDMYNKYSANELEQICYYCCESPISLDLSKRLLRSEAEKIPELDPNYVPEGAKIVDVGGQRYLIRKENFEDRERFLEKDGQPYFDELWAAYQQRVAHDNTTTHLEDYLDVDYWPYEAFLKVGTEYYFRYEGTQVSPPCFEVVHWRTFKDPIRVHARQIYELNRLLAWRKNPDTCITDTAGVLSEDKNKVFLNRTLQYYTSIHREVFCECQDWPSKFPADKDWCKHWKEDLNYTRFYEHPYSFGRQYSWSP